MDDSVALEDACNEFHNIDPNMDGSAEGDFMKETVEAVQ